MKHEILEEVWRAREKISAECGHDLKRLAARMRRLEAGYGERLAQLPVVRPAKPRTLSMREEPPTYGRRSARKP